MKAEVERYVQNCHPCRQATVPRDKTPGYLHLLPVPDFPWQHLTMDYKSMPRDKHSFDTVFVIIDQLSKQAISIPYHKTVTTEDIAQMFISYVYCYFGMP
jgi:hypothetical protein